MTAYRDIILRRQDREDKKQDRLLFKRAVLTTEGGLQTSTDPFNDVWASTSLRRVFYMAEGAVQPAQILCRKISDPYVGLGVIIGYADGSNQLEVLSDDFFLTRTGDPTGWASTSPRDFEPGGRKQMWVYTKVITPLATYPGSGVAVNVILGDYPYLGTRKSFAGSVNYDLSASVPGGGLCRYAGLYLDAANTLQTVNGATIAAGSTPAEPSWPAGAFRLCVVLLTNGDTSIDFANILDRRMAWSDEQGSSAGWPFAHVLTVSPTDPDAQYTTIGAAITAASAGDIIQVDAATYTEALTIAKNLSIVCLSPGGATIQTTTDDSTTVTITTGTVYLRNLTIKNTGAGTTSTGILVSGGTLIANNCVVRKITGAATNGNGIWIQGGSDNVIRDCDIAVTGATNGYGVLADNTSTTSIFGGIIRGVTFDVRTNNAGATLFIFYTELFTVNQEYQNSAGNLNGEFYSQSGYVNIIASTQLKINNTASINSGAWLIDESLTLKTKEATLAAAITAAADGDTIHLDTDTYSVAASQNISNSVTVEGDGPEATIYTTSVSNATAFDITADNKTVVFKDLTIKHTGGGVAATGIFSNNSGVTVILDNAVVEISSGAGTSSRGLWIESGTWILRNGAKIVVTSGTNKYGIYNDSAAATITIGAGCEVGGATADIYSDQSGSTITLNNAILTNSLINCVGPINENPANKIPKNLLYHSMHFSDWQEGTTFNDIGDATTYVGNLWLGVQNGQSPDVAGLAGGSTSDYSMACQTTMDSAASQNGFVLFLTNQDTIGLRGKTVSVSAELWGTNVANLAMNVLVWTSTADSPTKDVVGTWNNGSAHTLAANWAFGVTSVAIPIGSTEGIRYATNNIPIPTNANNLAVFISTWDNEASTDVWQFANVQLEIGNYATQFRPLLQSDESRRVKYFVQTVGIAGFFGAKADGNTLQGFADIDMRAAPTLSHNVTGWDATGSPSATQMGFFNYASGAFTTITGALTIYAASAAPTRYVLGADAATSFNGTVGDVGEFFFGSGVIIVLSARF